MTTLEIKADWNITKGRLKQKWAKLTDEPAAPGTVARELEPKTKPVKVVRSPRDSGR